MNDKPPDHWADLSEEEKRALLDMAKSRIWWEQALARLAWLKTLGVIVMGIVLFVTWGRDALAEWLYSVGPKP